MDGTPFKQMPLHALEAGYTEFLEQCCRQASGAGEPYAAPEVIAEVIDQWPLPDWLQSAMGQGRPALIDMLSAAPAVLAHGDAHPNNLILLRSGATGLIDLERADRMPFFFDALYILRCTDPACKHLRERYLAGAFDGHLQRLWKAAGQTWNPEHRLLYLLAIGIAHGLRALYRNKPVPRRARRVRNVTRALEECFRR
ncbi:phosphotransferase [Desulfurivibrio alkaliphilus]|nr:phosphotransferase [Desulfurivibrio alkaliphilus]